MASILRSQARGIESCVRETTIPDETTRRAIDTVINASAQRVFEQADAAQRQSNQIAEAVKEIEAAPRICGGFTRPKKTLLPHLSRHEQMAALSKWMEKHPHIRQKHTMSFTNEDGDIVPLTIQPPPNSSKGADLLNTLLGWGNRSALKSPRYSDFQTTDPKGTGYEALIDSLNSLEFYRQPHLMGAILLKSNPYEGDLIAHTWRYQVSEDPSPTPSRFATVELTGQRDKTKATARVVEQAAAHNLLQMIAKFPNENLVPLRHYEDFFEDGYQDDNTPTVTPRSILRALPAACTGDTTSLDEQMAKLAAARMQIPTILPAKEWARRALFQEDGLDL